MLDDAKVIVSLTSLPRRLPYLEAVLRGLSRQTLKPDKIHLWLCPFYQRLEQHFSLEEVPPFIANYPVEVELVEDWGPVTKLYPIVQRYANQKTVMIITDDDRIVPNNFVSRLSRTALKSGAVCGTRGRVMKKPFTHYNDSLLYSDCGLESLRTAWRFRPVKADILTGTGGMAFPPGTLTEEFIQFWRQHRENYGDLQALCDDIWINGYLAERSIPRLVLPRSRPIRPVRIAAKLDSLWEINRLSDANNKSMDVFAKHWK